MKVSKIKKGEHLFSIVEVPKVELPAPSSKHQANNKINKETKVNEIMEGIGVAEFSDWEKLDLRVAQIKNVEEVTGADKLWKLTLDVGELGERIICAGIKQFYTQKELTGKKIIYFSNLKPRMLKGVESQGMLLAAGNKETNKCVLISPISDIENGCKIG